MSDINNEQVLTCLSKIIDKKTGKDVVTAGIISGLVVKDGNVGFALEIIPEEAAQMEELRKECESAVHDMPGVRSVTAVLTAERAQAAAESQSQPAAPQQQAAAMEKPSIPGVKSIIAVASGKGGVGKSTTAVNLALAFAAMGKKVGILDADIYGPSLPRLLGITGRPESEDGKSLLPMESRGLKVMSMGFMVEEDSPMIWRGPMVMSAIQQMLHDVAWGELDILVVDMPPGTGDAQLTLAQRVPLAGAVIVSTPQDIALIDARKGLNMFRKVEIPVLGIIENMSYFLCPSCGERSDIFGHGGAKDTAKELGVDFLGEIPLHMDIRITSDAGDPIVASAPDSEHAEIYAGLAARIDDKISEGTAAAGPRIVVK